MLLIVKAYRLESTLRPASVSKEEEDERQRSLPDPSFPFFVDEEPLRRSVCSAAPTRMWWLPFSHDMMTMGRLAYNELVLPFRSVSNVHARLYRRHKKLYLEDLGSTNGTYVNGFPLERGTVRVIGPDDDIRLGAVRCQFQLWSEEARLPPTTRANSSKSRVGSQDGLWWV